MERLQGGGGRDGEGDGEGMVKVTAIVPCLNEEAGIGHVVGGFPRERMARYGYALDVLVVDNGSIDRTREVAASAGARVIREDRRGKGYAVRTAFDNLSEDTDLVIMLDGDNTYRSDEALRLLEPITSGFANVVVGSRLGGRIATGSMPSVHRTGNWVYSHLVRYAYRVNVTDVLTGYFAWHRDAVTALRPHLTSSGFTIEMEMITKMARLGHQMCSVPISYQARHGASSLKPLRDGASILGVYARNLRWRADAPAVGAPVPVYAVPAQRRPLEQAAPARVT